MNESSNASVWLAKCFQLEQQHAKSFLTPSSRTDRRLLLLLLRESQAQA
jgi:hypothetical protein